MEQELDYAEMLEIPVSTVNVTKKKSFFKRKPAAKEPQEELKELVVDSVNERVGAYVYAEDLSDPPPAVRAAQATENDRGSIVLVTEMVAVCLLAIAIFLTNIFVPSTVINSFIATLTETAEETYEPAYSELTLSSVVSQLSDAEVSVSAGGVLSFTAESSVYPICDGTVSAVTQSGGLYTVQIAHTSTFTSVITGLTGVYAETGTAVKSNIPFAYSDGQNEVNVTLYDGQTLLNCYSLSGVVPVWNS